MITPVKILIVEDEVLLADELAMKLAHIGYEVVAKCRSGEEAIANFAKWQADLVIMDIDLNGKLDGIETTAILQKEHDALIIYFTNLDDKEIIKRAKTTFPLNFIHKSSHIKQVLTAVEMAFFSSVNQKKTPSKQRIISLQDASFFIKTKQNIFERIKLENIQYIKADRAYCKLFTTQQEVQLVMSLKIFTKKYKHDKLMRVHRSYVVNLDKVIALEGNMIHLEPSKLKNYEEKIPIAASHRDDLEKYFDIR